MPPKKGAKKKMGSSSITSIGPLRNRVARTAGNNAPGFPATRRVTLRYVSYASISGGFSNQVVSANNIFDPDTSGGGHQPLGFDNWAALYATYIVVGSRIRVTFQPSTSSATEPYIYGVYLSDSSSLGATEWTVVAEQPACAWVMGSNDWDSGSSQKELFGTFDAAKFFNVVNVKDNESRFGGGIGGAPSDPVFFHLFGGGINGTAQASTMAYEIEYDVIFSTIKQLAQS